MQGKIFYMCQITPFSRSFEILDHPTYKDLMSYVVSVFSMFFNENVEIFMNVTRYFLQFLPVKEMTYHFSANLILSLVQKTYFLNISKVDKISAEC